MGQAIRNNLDLNCMSVPPKHRTLGDFHAYYRGEKQAPVLTLVIGGNHEASNYFFELYHGGWLAPNIYYLGAANVIRYGPFRIAGLSGTFKNSDYHKPHRERLPYSRDDLRSIYHVREYDVQRLLQIRTQVDIGISHDWPRGVEMYGDYKNLFTAKPHFLESAKVDKLGSAPAEFVMKHMRPAYWFSGHMHVRFSAIVDHRDNGIKEKLKDLGITRAASSKVAQPNTLTEVTNNLTRFLALDKIGPDREFINLMEIDLCSKTGSDSASKSYLQKTAEGKFDLQYDEEWLAITRSFTDALEIKSKEGNILSGKSKTTCKRKIPQNINWVTKNVTAKDLLQVPKNFEIEAPCYNSAEEVISNHQPREYPNSQTDQFYALLKMPNPFSTREEELGGEDSNIIFE